MKPFLKWAGGKRWLAAQVLAKLPIRYDRYIEPFVGSGAIFFALQPRRALLSDANAELTQTYRTVRSSPREVYRGLVSLHRRHNPAIYYETRASDPGDNIEGAIRFIYLNRTCWNGLYRVNRKNEFNVPIGTKSSVIFPDDDFVAVSKLLKRASLKTQDFEEVIDDACRGDLIYADPPYTVRHNQNGFLKYNQVMFSWDDQVRLHDSLVRAKRRGCHILLSNADHRSVRELYQGFANVHTIARSSVLAGSSAARGQTSEMLVVHHA